MDVEDRVSQLEHEVALLTARLKQLEDVAAAVRRGMLEAFNADGKTAEHPPTPEQLV